MKIGIIGAGKVGFTIGKYLSDQGFDLIGYYSRSLDSAIEASKFTNTEYHSNLKELIDKCDTLFLTVNDDNILNVCNELTNYNLMGKIICHTSGLKTSDVFKGLNGVYGYSIHPLYAINDKYNSYKTFNDALITIEGDNAKLDIIKLLFKNNKIKIIDKNNKVLYHALASYSSNLVVGLFDIINEHLNKIGFSLNDYMPLILNNINNINNYGIEKSLTGPILRNDVNTIKDHLKVIDDDIYRLLSLRLVEISKRINDYDYNDMYKILRGEKNEKNN